MNGIFSPWQSAHDDAIELQKQLQSTSSEPVQVRLLYNDMTGSGGFIRSAEAKFAFDDRASTKALSKLIHDRHGQRLSVRLLAHSAGCLIVHSAIEMVLSEPEHTDAERAEWPKLVHIVLVGGAKFDDENIFSDEWPTGIASISTVWDDRDGVSALLGSGCFWDIFDCDFDADYHGFRANYVRHLSDSLLTKSTAVHMSDDGVEISAH